MELKRIHTGYKANFVYNVSEDGSSKNYFTLKFRHIRKVYKSHDSNTLYLKVSYPLPHYFEEEVDLKNTRTTAICNGCVIEPELSDYNKLEPVICVRAERSIKEYFNSSTKWSNKVLTRSMDEKEVIEYNDKMFKKQMLELNFDLQYLMFCLLSSKAIKPNAFPFSLFEYLKSNPTSGKKALEALLLSGKKFKSIEALRLLESKNNETLNENFMHIKRIVATPCIILFQFTSLSESCRFFRKIADPSFALIAAFRNYDLREIGYSPEFVGHIKCLLTHGLKIGNRNFIFLGYSQSQIREHACWLIWDKVDVCESLSEIGSFDLSQHPAKIAARIGHAFTSTYPILTLEAEDIKKYPDITYNDYIFTDGCGLIAKDLCQKSQKYEEAIAFQVRIGGYKGVLKLDPLLPDGCIVVRPSMEKFKSKDATLEVIRSATYMNGYLNRELILLLETLGVKAETFIKIHDAYVGEILKSALENEPLQYLKQLNYPEYLQPLIKYASEVTPNSRFVKDMIAVQIAKEMKDIRKKTRIYIEKSCRLIGICDEQGILQPNEVFVQFIKHKHDTPIILTSKVFVTRNPCLHPGDIRILKAVNKKELGHLYNVIVFSSKGTRPTQNMMNNGDLDGDIYFICWDERIFPIREVPPAISIKQVIENNTEYNNMRTIRDKIIDFFGKYFRENCLGIISILYQVHADLSLDGALSDKCLTLARFHSTAVDFPKHGKNIERNLLQGFREKRYPDFVARKDQEKYESNKALGEMFRSAKILYDTAMNNYNSINLKHEPDLFMDEDLLIEGREKYIELAEEQYKEYRSIIRSLLKVHGVKTEAELISGSIVKLDRVYKTKAREHEINKEVSYLIKSMIVKFNEKVLALSTEEQLKLGSARYAVVYSIEGYKAYSYPWVLSGKELMELKKRHRMN